MSRDHMTKAQRDAMLVLDFVRAGLGGTPREIWDALIATGDAVGLATCWGGA